MSGNTLLTLTREEFGSSTGANSSSRHPDDFPEPNMDPRDEAPSYLVRKAIYYATMCQLAASLSLRLGSDRLNSYCG